MTETRVSSFKSVLNRIISVRTAPIIYGNDPTRIFGAGNVFEFSLISVSTVKKGFRAIAAEGEEVLNEVVED